MKIFVYHTPELTPTDSLPHCAVVIDVLRATTTIATALHGGAEAVQAFSNMELLRSESEKWPENKRLRAGERGGKQLEGCDLGNSPLDCTSELVKGKRLFLTTTNGTSALERVQNSPVVLTAAQINRQAVVDYLGREQPEVVWLVGSGWEGGYSLEDAACAGAIAGALSHIMEVGNDEVIAAIALYSQWENRLLDMFRQSTHGQRLLRLNCEADLRFCAETDILKVVPIQKQPGVLVDL